MAVLPNRIRLKALVRAAFMAVALSIGPTAFAGPEPIVIGEASGTAQVAEAICVLFRESRYSRRDCMTRRFSADTDSWPKMLRDEGIQVAVVSAKQQEAAWQGQIIKNRPALGDLRALFSLSEDKTLVTQEQVSEDLVEEILMVIFDNFYRLQTLYIPAVKVNPESGRDRRRMIDKYRTVPLHPGAWKFFWEKTWLPEPNWVILGSFREQDEAKRLAGLLAKKFPEVFDQGLQVRLATNDYFAVIDGGLVTPSDGKRRIGDLRERVRAIKSAYVYPATRGWGPDLLP